MEQQEKQLSFWDKNITPKTKEYKDFIREKENTPSEIFFKNGERKFTEKEKKFLEIYESKNQEKRISPEEFYARQNYPKVTADQLDNYISKANAYGHNDYYLEKITNLIYDEPPKYMTFSDAEKSKILERINDNNQLIEWFDSTYNQLSIKLKCLEEKDKNIHIISDFLEKYPNMGVSFFEQKEIKDNHSKNFQNLPLKDKILLIEDTKENIKLEESNYAMVNTIITQKVFSTNELNSILLEKGSDQMCKYILNSEENTGVLSLLNAIASRIKKNEVEQTNAQKIIENYHLNHNDVILKNILDTANPQEKELLKAYFNKESEACTNWYINESKAHYLDEFNKKYDSADETTQKKFNDVKAILEQNGLKDAENIEHSLRNITKFEIAMNFFTQKQPKEVKQTQKLNNMDNIKEFNQFDYLKKQLKYLGFGESEQLHQDLENSIKNASGKFQIHTTSDKVMKGNKADFTLNFNKSEEGKVFFNSYKATLTTSNGAEREQTFRVQKENNITAKEAINLLEGRAVKIQRNVTDTETGEITQTSDFIKLKLNEEKTEFDNYKIERYGKNYGIDIDQIMQNAKLSFSDDLEMDKVRKHLEKGNITNVVFVQDKKEIKGFAVLNPQWKMLNLYDEKMNRVNSNKMAQITEIEQNQKKNVPQHSHSRGV